MRSSVAGITFIELIIVLLVLAVLAAVALPMGTDWINRAQLSETEGVFEQAIGRAKSAALRNPGGVSGEGNAASALCLAENVISLFLAQGPDEPADCDGGVEALWSANLPGNVTVQANGVAFSCLCFNNQSLLLDDASACGGGCAENMALSVTAGTLNDTFTFH